VVCATDRELLMDVVFLAMTVVFFVVAILYVAGCDRL